MISLMKADFYRLFRSKAFIISSVVIFVVNIAARIFEMILYNITNAIAASSEKALGYEYTAPLSSVFSDPIGVSLLLIVVIAAVVSFLYSGSLGRSVNSISDDGSKKGTAIISEFIALGVQTLIFFVLGMLGHVIGHIILGGNFTVDAQNIPLGITAFFSRWLLIQAMTAIILFISTGLRNKKITSIVSMVFGSGSLIVAYLMIDSKVGRIADINLKEYAQISLIHTSTNLMFINVILVSAAVMAIFIPMTVSSLKNNNIE